MDGRQKGRALGRGGRQEAEADAGGRQGPQAGPLRTGQQACRSVSRPGWLPRDAECVLHLRSIGFQQSCGCRKAGTYPQCEGPPSVWCHAHTAAATAYRALSVADAQLNNTSRLHDLHGAQHIKRAGPTQRDRRKRLSGWSASGSGSTAGGRIRGPA